MLDRIKIILVALFFVALLIITGRGRKDVLEQKDPSVLNFLAAGYCPGVVQAGHAKPLTVLNRVKAEWESKVAEYYKEGRPGFDRLWKVRFLENPDLGPAKGSWALTRLMGGMAPEFMYSMSTPEYVDRCNQWYVDLSPYLNKPNPYALDKNGKPIRWLDTFYPGSLARWRATADRHLYCIPVDQVEIAIYYNKTIMDACGIDLDADPPSKWDWAHFMEIQQRIKAKGYIPFLMPASDNMRLLWMHDIINDMIYASEFDKLNAVDDPDMPGVIDIDGQEKVRAVKKNLVPLDDDRYWETWRIIKDWQQYWEPNATGTRDTTLFQQGKMAMTVDGSWYMKTLDNDQLRKFEYGFFFIPKITKRTSSYSIDSPARGVGGSTAIQYSITKETAERKDAVEACVDLLMYISAPQNLGPMVAEGESFLPTVRGTDQYFAKSRLRFMLPVLEAGGTRMTGTDTLDARCRDEWWANMQGWLQTDPAHPKKDDLTREQIVAKLKAATNRAADEAVQKNATTWEWVKDANGNNTWDIPPKVSKLKPEDRPTTQPGLTATEVRP